jgi:exodeoxyribonuclease VII small subunit
MTEYSLEASLKRMQEIVKKLEQNDTPLEESLKLFEEGVGLARKGHELLNEVEKKIEILTGVGESGISTAAYEGRD